MRLQEITEVPAEVHAVPLLRRAGPLLSSLMALLAAASSSCGKADALVITPGVYAVAPSGTLADADSALMQQWRLHDARLRLAQDGRAFLEKSLVPDGRRSYPVGEIVQSDGRAVLRAVELEPLVRVDMTPLAVAAGNRRLEVLSAKRIALWPEVQGGAVEFERLQSGQR
jgi:hypothetical protein